jgi:small conductance mechanosensitive channel
MTDIQTMLDTLWGEYGEVLATFSMDLLSAIAILIIGWWAAAWAKKAATRALERTRRVDRTLVLVLSNLARYFILITALIAVLSQFGVQTASIIAALGAAGLAIGLALQGTLSNIAAGVMLLLLRPFRVGDYIDADGIGGTVDEIGLFTTQMRTADGIYISVPNASIWNRTIRNYSRLPTRRLDVGVGISYDDDIEGAQKVLQKLMEDDERVLDEPAPQVMVMALADSSVNLNMRCWATTGDYWGLLWDMNKAAKNAVEEAGYSIPFPQQDVHFKPAQLAALADAQKAAD